MVVFIDPVCPAPYSRESLHHGGLGGTEATVVRVAERLNALVAQHCRTEVDERYVPCAAVDAAEHLIVLREPTALLQWSRRIPHAKPYLWLHDLLTPGSNRARELASLAPALKDIGATIICVSSFHRAQAVATLTVAPASGRINPRVIYNPIADELQPTGEPIDPFKLIFASQPKKALEFALLAFQYLHAVDDRYRLQIAHPCYRSEPRRAQRGVSWLGTLPHPQLMREIATAACVFYPNFHYPETFGLVFAESNALGTPVLTHAVGAAAEVLKDPRQLLDIDPRLSSAYRISKRLPRGVLRRAALRVGGLCGSFRTYRDTIVSWSQGDRPQVRGADEFRLSRIAASWRALLDETA
jgi:glycosyltransferase involved in cell wall biosynthesis